MARRIAAALGFIVVVALALTLLWRVYQHHHQAAPYADDEPQIVRLADDPITGVKFSCFRA